MTQERSDVQPLDKRGTIYTIVAFVLAALYQSLWYIAPNFLAQPLWQGGTLSVAFLLGTIAITGPILLAWLISRDDIANTSETYETSNH